MYTMYDTKKFHVFPPHFILFTTLIIIFYIMCSKVVFIQFQLSHTLRDVTKENTPLFEKKFPNFFNIFSNIITNCLLSEQKNNVSLFFLVTPLYLSPRLSHKSRDVTRENNLFLKKKTFKLSILFTKIFKKYFLVKQRKIVPLFSIVTSLYLRPRAKCAECPAKLVLPSTIKVIHTPTTRRHENAPVNGHLSHSSHRVLVLNYKSSNRYILTYSIIVKCISHQGIAISKTSPPNPLIILFVLKLFIGLQANYLPSFQLYATRSLFCRRAIYLISRPCFIAAPYINHLTIHAPSPHLSAVISYLCRQFPSIYYPLLYLLSTFFRQTVFYCQSPYYLTSTYYLLSTNLAFIQLSFIDHLITCFVNNAFALYILQMSFFQKIKKL